MVKWDSACLCIASCIPRSATSPDRMEWYLNGTRQRSRMPEEWPTVLPSGTTSNEALHAELNRSIRQTQVMYKETLQVKLDVVFLAKLISHTVATRPPTISQQSSTMILAPASVRDQCMSSRSHFHQF